MTKIQEQLQQLRPFFDKYIELLKQDERFRANYDMENVKSTKELIACYDYTGCVYRLEQDIKALDKEIDK